MKKLVCFAFLIFFAANLFAQQVLPKPNPPRLVVDAANLLSPEQQQILEQKLDAFNDTTSNQIAVVTINDLNDVPVEDYANKLFREWGIGGSKHNNGVLLLVSKNDHKIRIEVGYGLEGAITDVQSKDIIANDLTPNFKQDDYYTGLQQATSSLEQAAAGEYHERGTQKDDNSGGGGILTFVIILIVVFFLIGRGRGGGGMMSRRGIGSWLAPAIFMGGWGRGGSGGGFGGGGFGGGGGGFGGFGGGSSGGGGASGGW